MIRILTILALSLLTPALASAQTFEVATIKQSPNGNPDQSEWSPPNADSFKATSITFALLLRLAWGIDTSQIANQPSWFDSDLFDVVAKPEAGVILSREQLRPRLQSLLAERFHLTVHHETRMLSGYALVVAKDGPRLTSGKPDGQVNWRSSVYEGHTEVHNCTMPFLAQMLTPVTGFPVVDQTGLPGHYDIKLLYASNAEIDSTLPSLFAAIHQTLGLELKSHKVPVDTLVIDHVDRQPAEN